VPIEARDAFLRSFSPRHFVGGGGRVSLAWSALSGVLLLALLLELGLLLSLLIDQGRLPLSLQGPEIGQFESLTGHRFSKSAIEQWQGPAKGTPQLQPAGAAPPEPIPQVIQVLNDSGILPSVWRNRDEWWGGLVAWLYRQWPALRGDGEALVTLLLLLAVTWLARVWIVGRWRRSCRWAAFDAATRLRRQLARQASRLGVEDLDGQAVHNVSELFITQVNQLQGRLFDWIFRLSRCPMELLFLLVAALSVEVLLTVQWLVLIGLGWYAWERMHAPVRRRQQLAADRSELALRNLASGLATARLVRGYGLEAAQQETFQQQMLKYVDQIDVETRLQDDPLWLRLVGSVGISLLGVLLMFIVAAKVLAGEISVPGAGVFLAAMGWGSRSAADMLSLQTLRAGLSSTADAIWRYLDRLPVVSQAVGAKFIEPVSKTLHFEGVCYDAPHHPRLLDRIDLKLNAGRSYAVVSLNPLESLAFVSLLPRFLDPQAGRVLFDGEDIAWGTLESVRAEVLLVSAVDPVLPGTVLDNLRAGRPEATMAQVTDVAKEARAHNFISRLPQGYETVLSAGDNQFDEGQRYRLALARALLRNPAVLILQEPATEVLDDDTKQLLDDTYTRICQGRTVFFLPQRLTTLKRVDEILVLYRGRVAAMGPRDLLVSESPLYRHWEYLRFHEYRHDALSNAARAAAVPASP
jgi:ATP-binding cassette, subfamily B, bacterial